MKLNQGDLVRIILSLDARIEAVGEIRFKPFKAYCRRLKATKEKVLKMLNG